MAFHLHYPPRPRGRFPDRNRHVSSTVFTQRDAMKRFLHIRFTIGLLVLATQLPALAQTQPVFRVETAVYTVKNLGRDQLVSETTTYFTEGEIINVHAGNNGFVKIIDRSNNTMTLVDFERSTKTQVSADEILRTVAALLARTDDKPAIVREAASPKFVSHWNEKKMTLELKGKSITYEAKSAPPAEVSIVNAYRQFADWSARLNATRPGGLPPTARIMLNAQLAEHGAVPITVTLSRSDLTRKLRSTHKFATGLTKQDRSKIDQLKDRIEGTTNVDFVTFHIAGKKSADNARR